MALSSLYGALLGLVVLYLVKLVVFPKQTAAPLPPGPKPKPIIGNLGDLPPPGQQDWKHWMQFKKLYGAFHTATSNVPFLPFLYVSESCAPIFDWISD